jgi:hypothetical protein
MSKRPTTLPVNEGSDGVLDLNGKAQAYMRLAAEHAQRAATTTNPKLAASYLDLARSYRELAIKTSAPMRWRARPPTIDRPEDICTF